MEPITVYTARTVHTMNVSAPTATAVAALLAGAPDADADLIESRPGADDEAPLEAAEQSAAAAR